MGHHQYADDEQLYCKFKVSEGHEPQATAFSTMSSCLRETREWMAANDLKLNDNKTDAMVICSSRRRDRPAEQLLTVGECQIAPSPVVKNLGVVLDSHLTMAAHVTSLCRRAYFQIHRIGKIKKFLDRATLKTVVVALVLSVIDGGNSLLIGLPAEQLNRLQAVQNSAVLQSLH